MRPALTLDPAPLLGLTHGTDRERAEQLRVSMRTIVRWRNGASRVQAHRADRLACAAGVHPYNVWPELADRHIEAELVTCEACPTRFIPKPHDRFRRFCSPRCQRRVWARQRRATPEGAEANRAARRRYYADNAEYERARERRDYRARRDPAA